MGSFQTIVIQGWSGELTGSAIAPTSASRSGATVPAMTPSWHDSAVPVPTTALLTDRYELTMLGSALRDGTARRECVFEVFARRLPDGRRYGVVAGTGRLIEALADFTFDAHTVDMLRASGVVDDRCADYLRGYRFTGDI